MPMSRCRTALEIAIVAAVSFFCGAGIPAAAAGEDQAAPAGPGVPGAWDTAGIKAEIAAVSFVAEYPGANGAYVEKEPEGYRAAVITLRLKKAAGASLTLHPADISLHYRHGGSYDVSPCKGMSSFGVKREAARPMRFFPSGFGEMTADREAAAASTIYVDFFFMYMERDTAELSVLIAQPVGLSAPTRGWSGYP